MRPCPELSNAQIIRHICAMSRTQPRIFKLSPCYFRTVLDRLCNLPGFGCIWEPQHYQMIRIYFVQFPTGLGGLGLCNFSLVWKPLGNPKLSNYQIVTNLCSTISEGVWEALLGFAIAVAWKPLGTQNYQCIKLSKSIS